MEVVLASNSPRRRELLYEIFSTFTAVSPQADETIDLTRLPYEEAIRLAYLKASSVSHSHNGLIIGVDTIVYLDKYYGKPDSTLNAGDMLRELSGKTHKVYTGIAVILDNKEYLDYDVSEVKVKKLNNYEIDYYIEHFKPFDKAGSYGIQDNYVVESYSGSYSNIVGLPIEKLKKLLLMSGVNYGINY